MAVRIARAITRTTKKFLPFKINPICTRRGKWRLRVAPRLINRPPLKEGRLQIVFVIKGKRFCSECASSSLSRDWKGTQTIRKSLKDFELSKIKRCLFQISERLRCSLGFFGHLYKNVFYTSFNVVCVARRWSLVDVMSVYFLERGASKFGDMDVSWNRIIIFLIGSASYSLSPQACREKCT